MAAICRLLGRKQLLNLSHEQNLFAALRPITIKATPYKKPEKMTLHERAVKLKRPQSPHLTIYAPQLTSMMSITHRFSGVALTGYSVIFAGAAIAFPQGSIPYFFEQLHTMPLPVVLGFKFMLALPFVYHFGNGVRHLLWDVGKFLTVKDVYKTGYSVLLLTLIGTGVLMAM